MTNYKIYDCAIIGGGPAGLNAALVLGRARRDVILLDDQTNRNQVTHESHGFITRDGVSPAEFRKIGRTELQNYPSIQLADQRIINITQAEDPRHFILTTSDQQTFQAEKIILASGVKEKLPNIRGIESFYGKSLFNCPYCDGWELRDQPLIIINDTPHSAHLGKLVFNWSQDIVIATNGVTMNQEDRLQLEERGIVVVETPIKQLSGLDGQLQSVEFNSGEIINCSGGFVAPSFELNPLREMLGCEINEDGALIVDEFGRTTKSHVYAAGDVIDFRFSQLIASAASGNKVATAVNADLTNERF